MNKDAGINNEILLTVYHTRGINIETGYEGRKGRNYAK